MQPAFDAHPERWCRPRDSYFFVHSRLASLLPLYQNCYTFAQSSSTWLFLSRSAYVCKLGAYQSHITWMPCRKSTKLVWPCLCKMLPSVPVLYSIPVPFGALEIDIQKNWHIFLRVTFRSIFLSKLSRYEISLYHSTPSAMVPSVSWYLFWLWSIHFLMCV